VLILTDAEGICRPKRFFQRGGTIMRKLITFMVFMVCVGTAQVTNTHIQNAATAAGDSLVDIFPLEIGNQWIYRYSFSTFTESFGTYHDTGSATIRIFDRTVTTDTIKWLLEETHRLWMSHDTGAYYGSPVSTDTIQLIELQQGQHRLYINGDEYDIRQSVFSFFPHVDTIVYRYNTVDTLGIRTFTSRNLIGKGIFAYVFKQGIGLSSVMLSDGCTCMDGFSGHHTLRAQTITGVSHKQSPSVNYRLTQNFPNPFNPTTNIAFQLPSRSYISLKIFDCIGREIETLVDGELLAGSYTRQWDASHMPSGVYFYRFQAGSFVESKKVILLK
jgi:hypothetical protein